ncbi:MAG: polysaccharide deacetylase family protein [Eubacterium sp.]
MSRKIRITGAFVILFVFFAGLISACAFASKNVGNVSSAALENVGASTASIKWNRVGSADGYFVYAKTPSDSNYSKIGTVEDGSVTTFKAEKLDSSCDYSVYVNAYKTLKKGVAESKKHKEIEFKTVPKKTTVKLSSESEGTLKVSWKSQKRIDGYEIQYVKGNDFTKCETLEIKDSEKTKTEIKKLTPEKEYSVRIRAYYSAGEVKVYGEWNEPVKATVMKGVDLDHLDPSKPMIAITYDDGPGYNKASDKILDVLEKYGARATFFMLGKNAADHPDNVKRKIKLGCEIGNHTYDHNNYGKNVTANDIKKSSEAIYKAGGVYPTSFRSPGGITTEAIRKECRAEKMPLYYWSLDTQDWKSRNADSVYNAVMNNVKDGDIILMHEIYDSTAEATARIVPELIKRGYQLVTCEELIAVKGGKPPVAGEQYVNATTINNKTS